MKKYKTGLILSAITLFLSMLNFAVRIIFKLNISLSVSLLCITAVIFCGCLVGYHTRKNGDGNE